MILEFWKAVELFSFQKIPKVDPYDKAAPVYLFNNDESCLWNFPEKNIRPYLNKHQIRQFQLFVGIYQLNKVEEILTDKLGKDENSFDKRPPGDSCLFVFSLDEKGIPIEDSLILSSCAWATKNTLETEIEESTWLQGFEKTSNDMIEIFNEYIKKFDTNQEQDRLQPNFSNIDFFVKYIIQKFKLNFLVDDIEIRLKPLSVAKSNEDAVDSDFLNSFYLEDLQKVSTLVKDGEIGAALSNYLIIDESSHINMRKDCRKDISWVYQILQPKNFPKGRWPSNGHFPLVLSQQFAINTILKDFGDTSGIFSVNGPPGTGKTTMLRDLIANIVVERAEAISKLKNPLNAFENDSSLGWESGDYKRNLSKFPSDLSGYEVVIASNNNGAVENVTLEIPGIDAIDPSWIKKIDYYSEIGTNVISTVEDSRKIISKAWGLFAGRLGNKKNRNTFATNFYFSDKNEEGEELLHFIDYLKEYERLKNKSKEEWDKALENFKLIASKEHQLRLERQELYSAVTQLNQQKLEYNKLEEIFIDKKRNKDIWIKESEQNKRAHLEFLKDIERNREERIKHRAFKPGFFEVIFSLGKKFKIWNLIDLEFIQKHKDLSDEIEKNKNNQIDIDRQLSFALTDFENAYKLKEDAKKILNNSQNKIKNAEQKWGKKIVSSIVDWKFDTDALEKTSPWADPEWNEVRADLFIASLHLHKAFIMINARAIKDNLNALFNDVMKGHLPKDINSDSIINCWRTLFLIVPVVSSTFASFARLFSHFKNESIGWLLIDEAGQSSPQNAAGAIWRSKRVIVVGDPLQLEPIVNIPFVWQNALQRKFRVPDIMLPSRSSVQILADRINPYGTYLESDEEPIWIGAPLKVHRRCDNPMFDISNNIAYDGMMVLGKNRNEKLEHLIESQWIHIASMDSIGHWIPEEGKQTEKLIQYLCDSGVNTEQIFIISPFRDVVKYVKRISRKFKGSRAGTIHTVQGKEADIVILVLGGDPKKPGAKAWAASKPNLLNVAASRAKKRLYVIGDANSWGEQRYFNTSLDFLNPEYKEIYSDDSIT